MLQIIYHIVDRLRPFNQMEIHSQALPDPGDHPQIRHMSLRELADLPFPRQPGCTDCD